MSGPDYRPGREVRVTSATGGQKGQKSIRMGGADPLAMLELGRVYGVGEKKYARYNYLKGYPWSLSIDALFRHMWQFLGGQEYDECSIHPGQHDDDHEFDPEVCTGSGLLHTAHVAWQALALTSFQMRGIGEDDRAPEFEPGPRTVTAEQALERAGFKDWEIDQFVRNVLNALDDGGEVTGIEVMGVKSVPPNHVAMDDQDRYIKPEHVNDAVKWMQTKPGIRMPEDWFIDAWTRPE